MSSDKYVPSRVCEWINSVCRPRLKSEVRSFLSSFDASGIRHSDGQSSLERVMAPQHGRRRLEQNLKIQPERPGTHILEIKPHHVVEAYAAASLDLP